MTKRERKRLGRCRWVVWAYPGDGGDEHMFTQARHARRHARAAIRRGDYVECMRIGLRRVREWQSIDGAPLGHDPFIDAPRRAVSTRCATRGRLRAIADEFATAGR